jgi:ribosomal subunit interface protein
MVHPTVDEEIHVQSSNVDIGDALTSHCKARILEVGAKFFGKLTRATVHFRHEGQGFACSVKIKSGALDPFAAEHIHADAYQAFNSALAKVSKQLRRTKRMMREDKAHRPEKDNSTIGRELNPQQPVAEILQPVTDDRRVHVLHPEAERYEAMMQRRAAE